MNKLTKNKIELAADDVGAAAIEIIIKVRMYYAQSWTELVLCIDSSAVAISAYILL